LALGFYGVLIFSVRPLEYDCSEDAPMSKKCFL